MAACGDVDGSKVQVNKALSWGLTVGSWVIRARRSMLGDQCTIGGTSTLLRLFDKLDWAFSIKFLESFLCDNSN